MGLEGFSSGKWPGLVRPKRSKSFPDSRGPGESNLVRSTEAAHQHKDILLLEKRLQDQVSVRCALEKALGYRASSHDITNEATISKVLLHDWWLIKADSDSQGRRLGIGGFTLKGNQGIRLFLSSPIVRRHDAVTLMTVDGITIMVHGHLNRSRTLENGFSYEVCDHFVIGFPYYWEEFAALSVDEAGHFSVSEGNFGSDAYKTPTGRDNGSNALSRNIFDDILQPNNSGAFPCSGGASIANKGSPPQIITMVSTPDETPLKSKTMKAEQKRRGNRNVENVVRSGPLTRSRTRLLDK